MAPRTQTLDYQQTLFHGQSTKFVSTRYQGSKAKLTKWIWQQIETLDFENCLDVFGGTGAVAYRLKQAGKEVVYNDALRFNHLIALALIENNNTRLEFDELNWLLARHSEIDYPKFIHDTFADIYFTDDENLWIDQTITNINTMNDPYKRAIAFFALCQACIIKRPFNLFHRKNLYIRFADVKRSFGNKTTWDKPFPDLFMGFVQEANNAIVDNGQNNKAYNLDAEDMPGKYDLVYIDTPYISNRGMATDYYAFYHFLEGLTMYDEWGNNIDTNSKHRRLKPKPSDWTNPKKITAAFDRLFKKYKDSTIVVSYRSDGIPSEDELITLLKKYKKNVNSRHYGQYKYVLSKNATSKEILLIGT